MLRCYIDLYRIQFADEVEGDSYGGDRETDDFLSDFFGSHNVGFLKKAFYQIPILL